MMFARSLLGVTVALGTTAPLLAQDTTRTLDQGVRVGITYTPGVRPGMVVVPGPGLDSLRAIVQRDLDFSDRFESVVLPPTAGLPSDAFRPGLAPPPLNYPLYRTLGASYGVELAPGPGGTLVRLHDITAGTVQRETTVPLPDPADPAFRLAAHRVSDEIVRWITGTPGIAATRLAFVADRRVWRIDSDGGDATPVTTPNEEALSPAWSPDGRKLAFTLFGGGRGSIILLDVASGARATVPSTGAYLNITPTFSPDGRTLAFARSSEEGTDIYTADVVESCCVQRLTVGRYADNLSPTFSPDGRRIAFVSTRAGLPQVYAMAADGTDQELLAPFDYGVTGSSNAPEWSPDGARVVFHREVARNPQLFLLEVAGGRVRQLTSAGRNEDATWAPDGRHLAFVSDRSGRRQLWVIDVETGRIRQVSSSGAARLPSWSRRLGGASLTNNP
jgi:TolB protein